ncbi:MAG TPA: ornithine cyclodeaminase family protein [Acidimicrobiia bacterium]|nr:ornithine cyclodeaminase family protein [Acidimicrobiia bacterium]
MRYLNSAETRQALPMTDAIKAMEHAFSAEAETPLRTVVGSSLVMPGRLDDVIAVKVVSTVPGDPAGLVVVFAPDGSPLGLVHGPTLTAIRTGAVCGLATALLATTTATTLAMLGAGAMAFDQIEAVRTVRPIDRVIVWSRNSVNARMLAEMVGGEHVEDAAEAATQADVISCATPATSPILFESSVREGAHVNAIGAYTPEMAELAPDLLERAYVVVDDLSAASEEAGDLIQAGRLPNTSLRELLAGTSPEIGEDVTVFKSVGVAAQDVAAAHLALINADRLGVGTLLLA